MTQQPQTGSASAFSPSGGKRGGWSRPTRTVSAAVLLLSLPFSAAVSGATDGDDVAPPETPSLPAFVFEPVFAANQGSVHGIFAATHADLVLVRGGFDSGFRTGMVCRVADAGQPVGEVMLVDVRNNCAAAIIVELQAGRTIEPGHTVSVKTVKF